MILRRLVGLAILVGLSRRTCQRLQHFRARIPRRPFPPYQPMQSAHPMKDSKSTSHRKPFTSISLGSPGAGVGALGGLSDHVGPSILVILVLLSLLLRPWDTHAINSSHPFQDSHHTQARRNIPPGRIGYPGQPTRSNRYSKPIPPTHTIHTILPAEALAFPFPF